MSCVIPGYQCGVAEFTINEISTSHLPGGSLLILAVSTTASRTIPSVFCAHKTLSVLDEVKIDIWSLSSVTICFNLPTSSTSFFFKESCLSIKCNRYYHFHNIHLCHFVNHNKVQI
eukprot:TRINITY_DN4262_c0_g1_i1.p1 TRINITY_DN4262_c0_g1~~TRINITY_DN4262_c0_g1_i1.p1  ORF type:complete len:116 (-),score=0.31 TRINITY_DN4262_c0_g1_i1:271-618(-)